MDNTVNNYTLDGSTFQKLKQNGESITGLSVVLEKDYVPFESNHDGDCFFNSVNWKEDGDCIAKNTQLKTLIIECGREGHISCTRQHLQDFFSCIYRNSSIDHIQFKHVIISDEFCGELIEGLCGHPSLLRLEFYGYIHRPWELEHIGCTAIGKVLKHPNCRLKDLRLSNCQLDDDKLGIVCDALLGNSAINTLHLDGNKDITSSGWRIVSYVLQHPNCNLIELDLNGNALYDSKTDILASALSGTSSLKILDIGKNLGISSTGWQTLLNQLSQTSIESLNISHNIINDSDLAMLANVSTLKSLDMTGTISCTPAGWQSFFNALQTRRTQLVKLDISYSQIGNVGATALGNLLSNMGTLKTLIMHAMTYPRSETDEISSQGWQAFFTLLQDSNMSLVKLSLWNNIIDDEGMQLLVRLVSRMSSLKYLDLSSNYSITPTGWQALTGYLQSPNFALTHLDVDENDINDDTVVAFTNALAHNKTLERFHLYACTVEEGIGSITKRGWEAVSTLICNKTSITDTFNSHHTLWAICDYDDYHTDDMNLPLGLASYLELNEKEDKVEVARQKILQIHFSSQDESKGMQELLGIELKVMPTAISWIGRPNHDDWIGTNVSGLSLMFNLVRKLPDLLDSSAQKKHASKKRKRAEVQFCCVS